MADIIEKLSSIYGLVIYSSALLVVVVLIARGKLRVDFKGVRIGAEQELERRIIRAQINYVHTYLEGEARKLPDTLDEYRTKYVVARVADVFEEAILFNHLDSKNPSYLQIKRQLVYNTVLKRVDKEYFKSQEFWDYCDELTKNVIEGCEEVRRIYTSRNN